MQHDYALIMNREIQDVDIETYTTVIRKVEDNDGVGAPLPNTIFDVLERYADLMHDEFLEVLQPRCAVDHNIELEPEKKPPTKAPYRLSG